MKGGRALIVVAVCLCVAVLKLLLRPSNLLCMQERDGVFMLAFADPADAITWAVLLQLALLRYLIFARLPWRNNLVLKVKLRDE